MDVERYQAALRPLFAGRRVVLIGGVVQMNTPRVVALRALGAERCLVIGSMGTGEAPAEDDADLVLLDVPANDIVEEIRAWERITEDPPAEVRTALDRYDPDGEALLLLAPFGTATTVAGRTPWGARPATWTAIEDKTRVDALCDRAGVARPPSEVVPVGQEDLKAAAGRLDVGTGTVWAGDARDGFNGGAMFVRWVRDGADADAAVAALAPHCDRVRVAPFLEGVPCSIHGFVTGDGVAALRPVELVTLRTASPPRLRYAGTATVWDPSPADREAMREVARRVGDVLRDEVGYRGAFTVDGVLTVDGFLPTEVNPRFGAGLAYLGPALPELSFLLMHHAAVAGELDVTAAEIEELVVPAADAARFVGTWVGVSGRRTEGVEELNLDDGARAEVGPSAVGRFVRIHLDLGVVPAGRPVASRVAAALEEADARLGLGLGPLTAAVPVR